MKKSVPLVIANYDSMQSDEYDNAPRKKSTNIPQNERALTDVSRGGSLGKYDALIRKLRNYMKSHIFSEMLCYCVEICMQLARLIFF